MNKEYEYEYKVIVYDELTKLENYEYFDNKKESIEYAKKMADKNTRTAVIKTEIEIIDGIIEDESDELIEEF